MAGFSLLELLIVIAMVCILIGLAIPTYNSHTLKVKRLDGKTALLDLQMRLERYFIEHHTYAGASIGTDSKEDILVNPLSPQHFYRLQIINQDNLTFLIQATPNPQTFIDSECGSLQLNNLGEKKITGKNLIANCW